MVPPFGDMLISNIQKAAVSFVDPNLPLRQPHFCSDQVLSKLIDFDGEPFLRGSYSRAAFINGDLQVF